MVYFFSTELNSESFPHATQRLYFTEGMFFYWQRETILFSHENLLKEFLPTPPGQRH